jgi:hypothetical protein
MTTGARSMPVSQASGCARAPGSVVARQNRSTSARSSSRRNAQPWLNPALGAWTAFASIRSTAPGSTGLSA